MAIGPGANDVFGSGVGDGDALGMLVYPTDDMEAKMLRNDAGELVLHGP